MTTRYDEEDETQIALKNTIKDLHLAQKIANIGNWTLDPDVMIPVWSEHIYKIYNRDPALGPIPVTEYKNIYKGKYYDIFTDALKNALHYGEPYDIILCFTQANGEERWIEAICQPEPKPGSDKFFLRGIIQDITKHQKVERELKEANQQLTELNKLKDKFFSIISHDLKSPFNGLLGVSKMLLEKQSTFTSEQIAESISLIYDTIQQTYKLIENLLEWSRIQTNRISFKPRKIEMKWLLNDMLMLARYTQSNKKGIYLQTNFKEESVLVYADKDMLQTVIRNLLSNAIKFSKGGQTVQLGCQHYKDNKVLCFVQDNGIGISPENQKRLFQLDKGFTTKGTSGEKGTGLGLILCKEFVQKNGGEIWLESSKGNGSCFYFTLKRYSG